MYGQTPVDLGIHNVNCDEMMFFQYLPIKLKGQTEPVIEPRLKPFNDLIGTILCDFVGSFGLDRFVDSYVYVTAKKMYQKSGCPFNRGGYHSDGFMTDDINYIWSDKNPTTFNFSKFELTMNDVVSLKEMEDKALPSNEITYPNGSLLRLNQYVIHKVSDNKELTLRTFLKVSFSKDKYDLKGNSKNYLLDYDWEMRDRQVSRNIPQKLKK